jgi:hypothetical protein
MFTLKSDTTQVEEGTNVRRNGNVALKLSAVICQVFVPIKKRACRTAYSIADLDIN